MSIEAVKNNIEQMKEITRELYVFTNQIDAIKNLETGKRTAISAEEKRLLNEAIASLSNQLKILNNSIPQLLQGIGFFKKLETEKPGSQKVQGKLVQVEYKPDKEMEKVSYTISEKDKKIFIENLSRSNLSVYKLKKKYSSGQKQADFGKPNSFAKLSNHFFRNTSTNLVSKGYFDSLNMDLRKMNSPFVVGTYVSMILLSVFLSFIFSLILLAILLFFNVSINAPFLTALPAGTSIFQRFFQVFWVVFVIPIGMGLLMYVYPSSEARNLGKKIDQELPFVAIHMSAIATSGVEPMSIFKIILKSEEYKYTNIEFRKLMNLINFHGKDFVTALKDTAKTSPSEKLKNLLDGLATSITSGGSLHDYLDKHSETLLFDYKLEREKYTKTSETFMDIYISIVIAAPMIFLMLFVIMGSTGAMIGYLGLGIDMLSFLIIALLIFINLLFLVFLKLKQPVM